MSDFIQPWMSELLKSVLSGDRVLLSDHEKKLVEKEMLDWEYRRKQSSVDGQTILSTSGKTMLGFWLKVYKSDDEKKIENGEFFHF